jgi:DNA polymerase type B, organellar and viral
MKFGYKFNITKSFLFNKSDKTFQSYIDFLFKLKKETPKTNPKYHIVKLLMNSLYGRTGIDITNLYKYEVINIDDLENIPIFLIEDMLQVSCTHALIAKSNNPSELQGNVALASAVTAYARIYMSEFKNNTSYNLFYTDTDSAFIDGDLPSHVLGKELGQFQLENKYNKFIALGAKVYGGITVEGNEIIKAKGMINKPSFNELELLLNEHQTLYVKKSFRSLKELINRMIWKEVPYLLAPNSNKRILVYENNRLVGHNNIKISK